MATGHYLSITNKLVTVDCCNCGVMFAVPDTFDEERRDNGKGFYCPNGHTLSYHETEIQRLRQQVEKEKNRSERAETRASYWQ